MRAPSKSVASNRPAQISADPKIVGQEIERLEALDLAQLRVQFRNRTGRIAPARISRPLLLRVLAYRMQAELYGDLRPDTRRLLDRITASGAVTSEPGTKATAAPALGVDRPRRGTVLVREWQGRMQHVMVLADGFAWNGSSYASLSAVASAMTGTKWNGRRFFGLDRQAGERPARTSGGRTEGLSGRAMPIEEQLSSQARTKSTGSVMLHTGATP